MPTVGVSFFGDACFLQGNYLSLSHCGLHLFFHTCSSLPISKLTCRSTIPLRFCKDVQVKSPECLFFLNMLSSWEYRFAFLRRTLEDLLPAVEMSHLLSVKSGKNPYPTITGFYLSILPSLKCVFLKHNEIEIKIKGFAVRQS